MFRELAVSYLGRHELAHVEASEFRFDTLGKGEDETAAPDEVESLEMNGEEESP